MEGILIIFAVLAFIAFLPMLANLNLSEPNYLNLEYFFNRTFDIFSGGIPWHGIYNVIVTILSIIAIILITVIIYSKMRIHEINEKKRKELLAIMGNKEPEQNGKNPKWEKVLALGNSQNQSDWSLAVIEADTILDDMLKAQGYQGESLGERLKSVEPADMQTLDAAWEAHKVRNRIAHEGSNFVLTKDDTHKTLGLFEEVFQEFHYI